MKRVLSLGAGVQSTTLALLAAHSEIGPMPDCAIFADTGWEPAATYAHLDWLASSGVLPFPIHRVSRGNLRDEAVAHARGNKLGHSSRPQPPMYLRLADGSKAMSARQCTRDYKVVPITQEIRRQLGVPYGRSPSAGTEVEVWIGISRDEAHRMKPSPHDWQRNRWPLIEGEMTRGDCLAWLQRNGYPRPPKSSCVGCPYRGDEQWMQLTTAEFADAVKFEAEMQQGRVGFDGCTPYLHRSMVPLDQVDFSRRDPKRQPDLFGQECEGLCGV